MKKYTVRKFIRTLGVVVIVVVLIIFTTGLWGYYHLKIAPFRGMSFSKEAWREAEMGSSDWAQVEKDMQCLRGAMLQDLKDNYLKIGKTSIRNIISLLGQEEAIQKNGTKCLKYSLGMCSGFKIDYDSLYVCFDDNDILKKLYIVQH
jgi:hypothetical protein